MKKLLLLIAVVFGCQGIYSQKIETKNAWKNEIGLHMGSTTGLGFSYRHWFGKAGLQLTGIPIKTDYTAIYSLGLTALYNFYDAPYMRVFGYIGSHYFYDEETGDDQPWKSISTPFSSDNNDDYDYYNNDSYYKNATYSIGFGPGFAFGKRVRFNLMVGYGFYDILETFEMYPTGEIGVYYRF